MYKDIYVYININMYLCIHACIQVYIYAYKYICVYINIEMYKCINAYIKNVYICTCVHYIGNDIQLDLINYSLINYRTSLIIWLQN